MAPVEVQASVWTRGIGWPRHGDRPWHPLLGGPAKVRSEPQSGAALEDRTTGCCYVSERSDLLRLSRYRFVEEDIHALPQERLGVCKMITPVTATDEHRVDSVDEVLIVRSCLAPVLIA